MKSSNQYTFSNVPGMKNMPRSVFNRSFGNKTTFNAGLLIPIMVEEALPGDTMNVNLTAFARTATPINPTMDNLHMDWHFFAVPYRIVWENFKKFMGEQLNPGDTIDYLVPRLQFAPATQIQSLSLADYMGLPVNKPMDICNTSDEHNISALFFRAYDLIYNEFFRDQNLQDSIDIDYGDGPDDYTKYSSTNALTGRVRGLHRRGKRHDYFTSCLPFLQKGDAIGLTLGGDAIVYGNGKTLGLTDGISNFGIANVADTSGTKAFLPLSGYNINVGSSVTQTASTNFTLGVGVVESGESGLIADLSTSTAITINDLREALALQSILELDARAGTRYTEILRAQFGVTPEDARLQRPEYLGGGYGAVNINPVTSTVPTNISGTPQGNLSGFGTASGRGIGFNKSFSEHCIVIGLVSVRADLTYQQGLHRKFTRNSRYEFYQPLLANLGEQPVLNSEIYFNGVQAEMEKVFGYQERWAEYRYSPSVLSGAFRSDYINPDVNSPATPLDSWHYAQDFASVPLLNEEFIIENPPIDRTIAIPSESHFIYDSYTEIRHTRVLPTYSVPGYVNRF